MKRCFRMKRHSVDRFEAGGQSPLEKSQEILRNSPARHSGTRYRWQRVLLAGAQLQFEIAHLNEYFIR
jgi:hypothetical protein